MTRDLKIRAALIVLGMALVAMILSHVPPLNSLHLSPLIIAVLLGALVGNIVPRILKLVVLSGVYAKCTREALRLGIILYGFRITLDQIMLVGYEGIAYAFIIVFSTFFVGFFASRAMGLDRQSASLISSGSAICGAAAVLATESIVKGSSQKVGIAVATVVVFGTTCMFVYPLVYESGILGFTKAQMGFFMGGSLHEVAHAVAAGFSVGGEASSITVIIKMLRVLMLVPFLLMLGLNSAYFGSPEGASSIRKSIPVFAIWFLVVVIVASLLPLNIRQTITPTIALIDDFLLTVAMFALGLSIQKDMFKKAGFKPYIIATIMLCWLILICYIGASILVTQ